MRSPKRETTPFITIPGAGSPSGGSGGEGTISVISASLLQIPAKWEM